MTFEWFLCPECRQKLFKLLTGAKVENIAVYCKRCKKEIVITK